MAGLPPLGQWGARVIRDFTHGERIYRRGEVVTAETMANIPLANRKALSNTGKIAFFAEPAPPEALQKSGDTEDPAPRLKLAERQTPFEKQQGANRRP